MTRKDQIGAAYRKLGRGASIYDGMMTCTTTLGTAISRAVWGIVPELNAAYLNCVFDAIPESFEGTLLEVPVGTGVLTMPLYQTLPQAQITCLDYSADMMASAQQKAEALGVANVTFTQGDVGALPFADDSFDIVLSMNGFHAFPTRRPPTPRRTACSSQAAPSAAASTLRVRRPALTGLSNISTCPKASSRRRSKRARACYSASRRFTQMPACSALTPSRALPA